MIVSTYLIRLVISAFGVLFDEVFGVFGGLECDLARFNVASNIIKILNSYSHLSRTI